MTQIKILQVLVLWTSIAFAYNDVADFLRSIEKPIAVDDFIPGKQSSSWLQHADLARASQVTSISTVTLPMYVNLFTVGFDGSGNLGINLPRDELHLWMEHIIDNSNGFIPHIFIDPLKLSTPAGGKNSPRQRLNAEEEALDAFFATSSASRNATIVTSDHSMMQAANVQYRYQFRLVETSPKVTKVVETFLRSNSRPVSPSDSGRMLQVDPDALSILLEDLVSALGLDDAYNLFVLNPRTSWMHGSDVSETSVPCVPYGYRAGLSNEEIEALLKSEAAKAIKEDIKFPDTGFLTESVTRPTTSESDQSDHSDARDLKFGPAEKRTVPSDMVSVSEYWAHRWLELHSSPSSSAPASASASSSPWLSYWRTLVQTQPQLAYRYSFKSAQQTCLVDSWVSSKRVLFLDLSAGPFSWGPVVGGEGVRTETSRPTVPGGQQLSASSSAAAASEHSSDSPVPVTAGMSAEQIRAQAELLELLLSIEDCQNQPDSERCQNYVKQLASIQAAEALPPSARAQQQQQQTLPSTKASSSSSPPPDTPSSSLDVLQTYEFLAHLSATLSTGLRHVLTPVSASDTAMLGYHKRVSFHVYVLANHDAYNPVGRDLVARIKFGLRPLRLPQQVFTIAVHNLPVAEDPTLAMALNSAMRTAVIPTLKSDGRFSAVKRMYVDSATVESELLRIDAAHKDASRQAEGNVLEVPIFIFSLDFPLPVLIDRHFQSRALRTMVIAVQSSLTLWESHLNCNHKPIFFDLRDPVASIVASTAQLLGGLMPAHVTSDVSHTGRLAQNWLWATGQAPFSSISPGLAVSEFHQDALARHYVVKFIRTATSMVNAAVHALADHKTTKANAELEAWMPSEGVKAMSIVQESFAVVRKRLLHVASMIGDLKYPEAVALGKLLRSDAERFAQAAFTLAHRASELRCVASAADIAAADSMWSWVMPREYTAWFLPLEAYLAAMLCIGVMTLVRLLVPRRSKAKLN